MPRPRAGEWLNDEIISWRGAGLDVVVSLLTADEAEALGLGDEPACCEQAGIRFIHFPISDRAVPSSASPVTELIGTLVTELRAGRGVGIHCRMGIGHSASLAVCVLAALGMPVEAAWQAVQQSRGLSVQTPQSSGLG